MKKLKFYSPVAQKEAIISGDKYRFTILTSRLIRVEYSENGCFEDRATQTVVNRSFDVPDFSVHDETDLLTVTTEHIELTYTKKKFSPNSLQIKYIGKNSKVKAGEASTIWGFGMCEEYNLRGTASTLDGIDGECKLEKSIMSRGCVTFLDDSNSLLICEDGTIIPRSEEAIDQYLFCYGDAIKRYDYKACLKDYYMLTGSTPLLPRFALGNWWSRYHAYTQQEYTDLVLKFKEEEVPFSVAVIDMDWHLVNIDSKYGSGWTGYTWNSQLFPDHKEFLNFLNREGMVPSLNLHPQEGVGAHETAYEKMATAMGIDLKTEKNVPFEIENPEFVKNYFKYLHHPLEEEGVRFWWIDWQQGNTTRIEGLDPLWMLNHLHYIDNCRNGNRGLLFSRYAGPGSHRYPVGFSGDTIITWESLDFQPYFTVCASNIGYGWWSHDIGGHMRGYRDEELITRWFQLGVFSPINRLHSSNSEFLGKEPWKFNKISELSMKKFLKLRHELIPYLYTMNYRMATKGEPLVQPLYYEYPQIESYNFKNEFIFGSEMIVAPITSPHDDKTTMGSVKAYIPSGVWYDFFTNTKYGGDKVITLFRDLDNMPVLVKSGGIVPMAKLSHVNDTENPKSMKIKVFAGDNNIFELYEDDGNTTNYEKGHFAITKFELKWSDNPEFTINVPKGDVSVIPETRNFEIEFIGINNCDDITVTENGTNKPVVKTYSEGVLKLSVDDVDGTVKVMFNSLVSLYGGNKIQKLKHIIEKFEHIPNNTKDMIYELVNTNTDNSKLLCDLAQLELDKNIYLSLCELITSDN